VLQSLADDGHVPTLSSLFERGVGGDLESQIPPWTPSAWPSLYTGVNPGKHGAFDFLAFDGYEWGIVDRTRVREHALWELLDRRGLSSVVVNVPVTEPPRAFDGALVPGYVASDPPTCHPEGVLDDLTDALGEYRVYAPEGVEGDGQRRWYRRLVEMRGAAFRHLVDEYDPDFGFLQFQQTDTVFHERPGDDDAIATVFEAVDEQLAATVEACDPDTVVVVSDHGIGPYRGYEFRVNEYLREHGFVASEQGEGGMPSWSSLNRERRGNEGSSLARRLVAGAARVGLTSQRIGAVLETLGLADVVLDHVSTDTVRAATERVDFASSTAYMRSRTELGVRINRAGREPDGIVSPSEYEAVRGDVVDALRAARTPEGDPVFEEVVPVESYFDGPYTEEGADVLAVPADFEHYLSASLRGDVFGEPSEPWNHKRDGVVAAVGDGVDAAAGVGDAHLFDVAPTVLSTLGVPPSTRMDGDPLPFVDAVDPDEYAPYTASAGERTTDEDVQRRLANLGYLDDADT